MGGAGPRGFTIVFGTRHLDAEHHPDGHRDRVESLVKLLALRWACSSPSMFNGFGDLFAARRGGAEVAQCDPTRRIAAASPAGRHHPVDDGGQFRRQFQVTVVENLTSATNKAIWLFPLYMIAINVFVRRSPSAACARFLTAR